jgi:rubrerythrin
MTAAWLKLLQKVCKTCGYKHYQYLCCPLCKRYSK